MRQKILWMLPKWPLPCCDGSRRAAFQLISSLTANKNIVDLCAICSENEVVNMPDAVKFLGVRNIYVIRKPAVEGKQTLKWLLSFLESPGTPVTLRPYCSERIRQSINTLIAGKPDTSQFEALVQSQENLNDWTCLVYEGVHSAAPAFSRHRFQPPSKDLQIIYRAQNREADLWSKKAALTSFFPAQLFLRYQAKQVEKYENSLLSKAGLAAISKEDLESFKLANPAIRAEVVPIGYHFKEGEPVGRKELLQIMYLGKLDWYPNKDGLLWFLQKIWPVVCSKRKDLRLTIAGSGDSSWLKPYLKLPNIEFLGKIESVDELYRNSALALVPVFYGSGTRVKAIEASLYSRACLSTKLGVQGLDLEPESEYLRAETEQEWIDQLSSLDYQRLEQVGHNAMQKLKLEFDADVSAKRFVSLLEQGQQADTFAPLVSDTKRSAIYEKTTEQAGA